MSDRDHGRRGIRSRLSSGDGRRRNLRAGDQAGCRSSLYPVNSEFFLGHASWSLFPDLVGGTARFTGMSSDAAIFFWYLASTLAIVTASFFFLRACFPSARAQWTGTGLLAVLLNVPVAGTALLISDPYLTARSLSTAATLFAVTAIVTNNWTRAAFWITASLLIHPQMAIYGALFALCHSITSRSDEAHKPVSKRSAPLAVAAFIPLITGTFHPARGAYREILASRAYFLVSRWHWWEWVGVFAPLAVLTLLARYTGRGILPPVGAACRASVMLGLLATASALVIASSNAFQMVARIQPMRSFHPIYMILLLLFGGMLGEHVLKDRWWRYARLLCGSRRSHGTSRTGHLSTQPALGNAGRRLPERLAFRISVDPLSHAEKCRFCNQSGLHACSRRGSPRISRARGAQRTCR